MVLYFNSIVLQACLGSLTVERGRIFFYVATINNSAVIRIITTEDGCTARYANGSLREIINN